MVFSCSNLDKVYYFIEPISRGDDLIQAKSINWYMRIFILQVELLKTYSNDIRQDTSTHLHTKSYKLGIHFCRLFWSILGSYFSKYTSHCPRGFASILKCFEDQKTMTEDVILIWEIQQQGTEEINKRQCREASKHHCQGASNKHQCRVSSKQHCQGTLKLAKKVNGGVAKVVARVVKVNGGVAKV
ncbi:hypothetical protein P3S67_013613 [Capsicum chacoense]